MMYKVFVGTLYSNEGDFEECVKSIKRQQNVELVHFIVSNKPEKEAHNELFNEWTKNKEQFDFFTKVDADTVLAHPFILESVGKLFQSNSRYTSIQAPLDDHMTGGMIAGLNSYTKRVIFNTAPELYCDRVDTNHDIQVKGSDVSGELMPAGFHCYSATPRQAFHFGLHRALKNQVDVLNRVKNAHQKSVDKGFRDDVRAFALKGAEAAPFANGKHNYTDERFEELFLKAQQEIIETA